MLWVDENKESCIKFMLVMWRKCSVMVHIKKENKEGEGNCVKDDVPMIQIDIKSVQMI